MQVAAMVAPMKTIILTLLTLNSTFAGIIEPRVIWDKRSITTCFYDNEAQLSLTRLKNKKETKKDYDFIPRILSRRERRKVQETIEANFSRERTGIHFVGWKKCSQESNPDLIVLEAKGKIPFLTRPSFNGRAVIGEEGMLTQDHGGNHGFFQKSGLVSHVALYTQNRGTVVHEFGHVAGLRHEHVNKASKTDPNCQNFAVTLDFDNLEPAYATAEFVTDYDPQSIMNYCWLQPNRSQHNRNKGIILSNKDIETLKSYYY